ncbi:hypothetical protein SAY87_006012 [Trapa incisa]|uniref:Uncharacterized protein n=1 Tax=Trapa incisa TaxID=236973 RepID=A0AAN7Q8E7_9MYRT|nr:hypothetical protein SAY87_006012 [Trapa incisa]
MTQLWILRWPKSGGVSTAAGNRCASEARSAAAADTARAGGSPSCAASSVDCCGLAKFVEKLKKRKRRARLIMQRQGKQRRLTWRCRQSSFQCRYDPFSYSLNFDTGGRERLVDDDEDYYQFHTFLSRFASNTNGSGSHECPSR